MYAHVYVPEYMYLYHVCNCLQRPEEEAIGFGGGHDGDDTSPLHCWAISPPAFPFLCFSILSPPNTILNEWAAASFDPQDTVCQSIYWPTWLYQLSSTGLTLGPRSLHFQWILQVTEMHKHINKSVAHWGQPLNHCWIKTGVVCDETPLQKQSKGFLTTLQYYFPMTSFNTSALYAIYSDYNPSTLEAEAGEWLQVQGQLGLTRKCQASQGYITWSCCKANNWKTKQWRRYSPSFKNITK